MWELSSFFIYSFPPIQHCFGCLQAQRGWLPAASDGDGLVCGSFIKQTTQKRCDTVGNKGRGAWKISQGLEGRTGTVYGRFIVCVREAHSDRDA
jgi:hypothetical protein